MCYWCVTGVQCGLQTYSLGYRSAVCVTGVQCVIGMQCGLQIYSIDYRSAVCCECSASAACVQVFVHQLLETSGYAAYDTGIQQMLKVCSLCYRCATGVMCAVYVTGRVQHVLCVQHAIGMQPMLQVCKMCNRDAALIAGVQHVLQALKMCYRCARCATEMQHALQVCHVFQVCKMCYRCATYITGVQCVSGVLQVRNMHYRCAACVSGVQHVLELCCRLTVLDLSNNTQLTRSALACLTNGQCDRPADLPLEIVIGGKFGQWQSS